MEELRFSADAKKARDQNVMKILALQACGRVQSEINDLEISIHFWQTSGMPHFTAVYSGLYS